MPEEPMSALYRSMIYVAVATMYFYRKDILPVAPGEEPSSFYDRNRKAMKRVEEEVGNLFDYELTFNQMAIAIIAYNAEPRPIEKPAAKLQGL